MRPAAFSVVGTSDLLAEGHSFLYETPEQAVSTVAQSSLSHCKIYRSAMDAHSTGTIADTGCLEITMPPEWMPSGAGSPRSDGQLEHIAGDLPGALLFRRGDAVPAVDQLAVGVLLPG
ncbi:Uncharacterised protein [Amycolatopsis camponoti]|uniref:Uncharacterized protein n=1 Tax=Amycolatopsis camponoti TaxID=2606593 RepID=A0A6I8LMW7_9PSEU|nr:Uncharacterised protein [Amycolatopsis camponoti]